MKFTESAYLAGTPIAGLAIAYLFEAGFANFHGIPASLIQLSISQLVGTGVLGLIGLWMLHTYFAIGMAFLVRRKHIFFKFIGLGMLYAAFPLLFVVGLGTDDPKAWIAVAAFFFMPTAIGLIEAITTKDKSKPFVQRWWDKASSSQTSAPAKSDGLDTVIDAPQTFFSILLVFIFLAFSLGHRYASLAAPTLVLKSDPTKAFIVVYGDKWFFRPLDGTDKPRSLARGELHIITGDNVKEVVLLDRPKADGF